MAASAGARTVEDLPDAGGPDDVDAAHMQASIGEGDVNLLGMATGESVACLNYLLHRAEVSKTTDDTGVDWYQMG
mgnify:CR=1 FL=1